MGDPAVLTTHSSPWAGPFSVTGLFGRGEEGVVRLNPTRVEVDTTVVLTLENRPARGSRVDTVTHMWFHAAQALDKPTFALCLPRWCDPAVQALDVRVSSFAEGPSVPAMCGDTGEACASEARYSVDCGGPGGGLSGGKGCRLLTPVGDTLPAHSVVHVTWVFAGDLVSEDRDAYGRPCCAVQILTGTGPGWCTRTLTPEGRPCPGQCALAGGYWRRQLRLGCRDRDHVGPRAGLGVRLHVQGGSALGSAALVLHSPTHDDHQRNRSGLDIRGAPDGGLVASLAARDGTVPTGPVVIEISQALKEDEGLRLPRAVGRASTTHGHGHALLPPRHHGTRPGPLGDCVGQARIQFSMHTRVKVSSGKGDEGSDGPQWLARR